MNIFLFSVFYLKGFFDFIFGLKPLMLSYHVYTGLYAAREGAELRYISLKHNFKIDIGRLRPEESKKSKILISINEFEKCCEKMEEKTKELIKKRITLCLVYNDYNVAWVTTDENAETIDVEETLKMIKENSEKYEEQMRNEKN